MGNMKKMMLGAALAVGTFTMTAVPAHAAHIGVYFGIGAPAYMPPYPGPGYAWVNGYWAGGGWTPGYWNYVGGDDGPAYGFYGYGGDDGWFRGGEDFRDGWGDRGDWGRGGDWGHRGDWGRGWGRGGDRGRR